MFKNLRKSVIAFLVAVPAVCACGAIAFTASNHFDSGGTIVAEAASGKVVTEVGDVIKTFDGTAYYGPDISKYWVTKILDGDGVELDDVAYGVTNAGEYYFYYTPQSGCIWADGSTEEKSYKVTITQATLMWKYKDRTTTVDVADAYKEVKYTESRTNYISKVYAECGNLSYNKSGDSSTKGVTIIKNGETTIKKNVIDSGTYTFTVAEEDIPNYKNPTFTFKILPMEIDIGKSVNLNWTIDGAVNESLANGDIYCYTYNRRGSDKVESAYTTLKLSKAPFNNWENWAESENDKAYLIEGIAAYKEDKTTKIKLYRDSGSLKLYNAVYSGDCSATESGKYVAKAVITPVDNYVLTYTPSDSPKNMTITPLEGGAYEITKTWYVAYVAEAASGTVVTEVGDVIRTFDGTAYYGPDNEKYWVTRILDGDGVELDDVAYGVTNAGEYTFCYKPHPDKGCVWADGSVDEKSYKVTITQATLMWKYKDRTTTVDVADAYKEVKYTESRTNYISKVYAECGNLSYNKSGDSSTKGVTIIKNGETTIKKNVIDSGTYTFTVAEEDIPNYKNPTFTFKILPMEIDIGKSVNLNWTIDGAVNESLANGDIYCYTYNRRGSDKVESAYTTLKLSKAPFNNWENWAESENDKAYLIEGIAAYKEDKTTKIKLYRDSGSLKLYNAVYSGDCSATESGKYVAKAVITPVDNYVLTYTPSDSPKNMTITPLEGGAYEITKTWYVAYVAEAASGTVVTEVGDVIKTFDGTAYYGPDISKYWVTKILDGDGVELDDVAYGVTNAGEYYFYYTPQSGCIWADGSTEEKSYKVTITQATLMWKYKDRTTTVDVADAYKEVKYTESRTNYISKVYAECGNLSYNKSGDSSTKGVTIIKNGETTIKKNVIDSGTYTFTVAEEDIPNYKNPTFTFKILPMEIDIGKSVNLNWTIDGAVNESLANGDIYCYTYNRRGSDKVESAYTTLKLSKAPFNNWENWAESENDKAYLIEGIAAYKEDKTTKIKLYRDSGSLKLYNAVYSGDCSATESGKYVAKAVITPVDNYVLTYTPSDSPKNMTITPLEGGAYEITKTWYVAYVAEAASGTVVTEVGDVIRTFDGTAYYGPDNEKYWVTRILDGDGVELDDVAYGVTNAGEYTFCYKPHPDKGCVWADGSVDEKSYKVTITQATLMWKYKDRTTTVDVADAYKEVKYTESRTNYISKVYAECGNLSYNKSGDSSTKGVTIIKNGETTIKKNVIDSGTYTFTVAEEDIPNYKNPTFTFKILPMEIDIGKSVNLNWTIDGAVNESLANGDIYCYTYNRRGSDKVESAYTTLKLSKAPFNNWENWAESENDKAYLIEGIAAYKEDKTTKIKLYRDSGSLQLYNAVYSGDFSATESGKYVAKAVITPVDNYALTYTPSDSPKNMTITPLEGGAYEITKTWYVAYFVNEFLSQSSFDEQAKTEYTFPQKWTFGSLTEEITAPCLAHGDEVRMSQLVPDCYAKLDNNNFNGYVLENVTDHETILEIIGADVTYREGMEEWERGEKDLVTFSITSYDGTTVCLDEPRSKLSYYVNGFMPVGRYTITFKAKNVGINDKHLDWWNGNKGSSCGNEYFGITTSYDFEVTPQKLNYTDNLNFYNKADKSPIAINLNNLTNNLDAFFALAYDRIEYDAITKDDVLNSQTYWSTVVDAFYGDRPELRFKLKDSDDEYYSKDNVTVWNDKISKYAPGSYYLYYTVNLPNYVSVPKETELENYYFEVTVYEEVELPYLLLDTLQYTGEPRTVQVAQMDHRYQVAGNTRVPIGEYKVTFTLSNPTLNRWKGVEGAVYELPWSIVDKPVNGWAEGGELHVDDWFWNSFDGENHLITAKPVSGEPVFSISTDEEGKNLIEGLQSFKTDKAGHIPYVEGTRLAALTVGDYYLWAEIPETDTHAPFISTGYKFSVKSAKNGWVSQPTLNSWKLGETPDLTAVNGASPIYGTAAIKIVSEFNEEQIYFDSASGLNKISEMPVGRYYLVATVEGDAACYDGITQKQSVLVLSEASDETWLIQPEIANWKHGETPSVPIAMSVAAGSTVEFSYLTKSGKPLESQPTAIGDYILVAVAYSQSGEELARSQFAFKITGIDGALIALIVIVGALLLLLGGVIIFIVVKNKRNKGGNNGGDNGGDEPNGGGENDSPEDGENADTPPNMPELTQNLQQNSLDQTQLSQGVITPKPTAKKVRSAVQKVRSQNTKIRSANTKVRAKKPDGVQPVEDGGQILENEVLDEIQLVVEEVQTPVDDNQTPVVEEIQPVEEVQSAETEIETPVDEVQPVEETQPVDDNQTPVDDDLATDEKQPPKE